VVGAELSVVRHPVTQGSFDLAKAHLPNFTIATIPVGDGALCHTRWQLAVPIVLVLSRIQEIMTMQKQNKRQKKLRFEGLENRALMAGDVTAAVVGGVLEITGDGSGNAIEVKQSGANWRVQGLGTTVNDSNSAQSFAGVTDIVIDLGDGNDLIKVSKGTLSGDLGIADSDGRTVVEVSKINATSIDIATFDDSDTITINKSSATNNIGIASFGTADDGVDVVTVIKSSAGTTFDVLTGGGNDVVTLTSVTANETFAVGTFSSGESDQDVVTISNSNSGDSFEVLTGDGRDTITLSKVQSGADLTVVAFETSGETSADTVNIAKSSAVESLLLQVGDGADLVTITDFAAGEDILISTRESAADANDILFMTKVNAGNDIGILTGDGTDTATLTKVVAVNELNVDMEAGNYDRLIVARSRALTAIFEGGGNTGDTLVQSRNSFGTETATGFEFEIG
jgi:hypothetical protein